MNRVNQLAINCAAVYIVMTVYILKLGYICSLFGVSTAAMICAFASTDEPSRKWNALAFVTYLFIPVIYQFVKRLDTFDTSLIISNVSVFCPIILIVVSRLNPDKPIIGAFTSLVIVLSGYIAAYLLSESHIVQFSAFVAVWHHITLHVKNPIPTILVSICIAAMSVYFGFVYLTIALLINYNIVSLGVEDVIVLLTDPIQPQVESV